MKVIKSSVDVLEQQPGIEGMKRHIELIGRLSHKSEDKITNTSYEKFIDIMKNMGHYAVFDMGTVYLKIPLIRMDIFFKLINTIPFTKFCFHKLSIYITTTYRIIVQKDLEHIMEKYWCEPTIHHYHRVTSHWICSRYTSHQIVRHASIRPIQESMRYCNYSSEKFGSGITYILPQWVYRVRNKIGTTIDPLTSEKRDWILKLDGEELWKTLCSYDRTVASRNKIWKECEDEYLWELSTDESEKLKPEEARGSLPHDTKTELYLCGYLKDWYKKPKTKERTGFFYLRSDSSAQEDVRVLSRELEFLFRQYAYNKLK